MNENEDRASPERTAVSASFFNRLHRYGTLLRTKWWILLLATAFGAAVGWFLLWHTLPAYLSNGRMIVSLKLSIPNASLYTEELNNFFGTQAALMQSGSVVNRVLLRLQTEKPELRAVPVVVQVTISPKTSIFNLRAKGDDPEYTKAYLEMTMEEYSNLKKEMRSQATDATKSGVQEELGRLGAELETSKKATLNFQSTNSAVFLQDMGNNIGNYLADRSKQLADLKSDLQLLKLLTLDQNLERQQNLTLRNAAKQPGSSSAKTAQSKQEGSSGDAADSEDASEKTPANLGGVEAEYLKAKQEILLLKAQREELGEFLRPKHPKMIALDEDIVRKEKLLEIFKGQSKDQIANRQHVMELQIQNLEAEIKDLELKFLETSKKMSDYQALKENNRRMQAMYDGLLTTASTLDFGKEISQESVTILEPASPATVVPPETIKRMSIASLLGFAVGLFILLFLNRLDDRPTSSAEMTEMFDEPIVGQIPLVFAKDKTAGIVAISADDDRHALVESYRNLRSSLVYITSPQPKTIVLTSAIPGDGKSMTSANLAITIAQSGAKVLLVDADLRRGVLHKHFNLPVTPGLSEVLSEQHLWSNAVQSTSIPNLSLLARGAVPKHPGELFLSPVKERVLKEVIAHYEFVLVDTPPIMAADDVSNLAPFVDGVIMVIRAGYTSGRVAQAALDLLYLRKVNVIGLVFNGVRANASEYYYYKYKEYYAT